MATVLATLVIGSSGLGLVWLALRRGPIVPGLVRAGSLMMAVLSLLLLPQTGKLFSVRWIPGGAISMELASPGVYMVMGVFWALALTLVMERAPPHVERAWPGLATVLCGLVAVALTLDHLLARYVVLELVSLSIILVLWLESPRLDSSDILWRRYAQFRLADAGLLLSILSLHHVANTFEVQTLLAAGISLPAQARLVIALGVLLAGWVKLGLPPFHGWLFDSACLPTPAHAWLAASSFPVLGAYLLYRFGALITSLLALRMGLWIAGALIVLWAAWRMRPSGRPEYRGPYLLIAQGALAFAFLGTGLMMPYLLLFVPLRLAVCLWLRCPAPQAVAAARPTPVFAPPVWLLALSGLAERVEHYGLEGLSRSLPERLFALARAAQRIEHGALEGLNRLLEGLVEAAGGVFQQAHTGRLRVNLIGVGLGLITVIAAALILLGVRSA